jgi:hypothetical protein
MLNRTLFANAILIVTATVAFAQGDIRKVNFQNFTYLPYCAGEDAEKVTVKGGEYSWEKKEDEYTDRFYFSVEKPVYGDLTGDKKDEAIILSNCNTGGTGQFTEGFVYTMKAGKPALLARIPGGDRAIGGLVRAVAENGFLVVEINDPDRNRAACCSEFSLTTKYRVSGNKLVQVGQPVSRELYPAQKVTFAKGASKTTFKTTVDFIKRFSVGARAGQTLTVSFTSDNTDNITLSLVDGEADITDGKNSFTAKLNQNGNFVIQLQNTYKLPSDVTLTIEIR